MNSARGLSAFIYEEVEYEYSFSSSLDHSNDVILRERQPKIGSEAKKIAWTMSDWLIMYAPRERLRLVSYQYQKLIAI